jgi:hypothetical protein
MIVKMIMIGMMDVHTLIWRDGFVDSMYPTFTGVLNGEGLIDWLSTQLITKEV